MKFMATLNKNVMWINAYLDYKPEDFKDIYKINTWSQIKAWAVILV